MTKITDHIFLGNSLDAEKAAGVDTILNVAHDLQGKRGWETGVLYSQVGLVDGPGNRMPSYYAAIIQLAALVAADRKVLVCDHDGQSRAVAVIVMFLHATQGRQGWDHWRALVCEKADVPKDKPHSAHKEAFDAMDWKALAALIEG